MTEMALQSSMKWVNCSINGAGTIPYLYGKIKQIVGSCHIPKLVSGVKESYKHQKRGIFVVLLPEIMGLPLGEL